MKRTRDFLTIRKLILDGDNFGAVEMLDKYRSEEFTDLAQPAPPSEKELQEAIDTVEYRISKATYGDIVFSGDDVDALNTLIEAAQRRTAEKT